MAAAEMPAGGWTEHKTPDGRPYYYNSLTQQIVWEKPAGFQPKKQLEASMEVEEESEDDDFRVVGKSKRRKTGEAIVGDGQEEKNLLNSNKFSPLEKANENNNNKASPAVGNGTPAVAATVKSAGGKKQPPLVVKNMLVRNLKRILSSCTIKPSYKLTRFDIRIICSTAESFDSVREQLIKNSVEFYTHQRRNEQPHRVVIRGLPRVRPEKIKELLKKRHNLDALEVYDIGRKDESTLVVETPYLVLFPKGYTNLTELRQIKLIRELSVRWEAYRKKGPNVTQCRNCLLLGHGTSNCHLKVRCSSCGGAHKSDECQLQEAQPKKCANCSGPHGAMDRSCPKRAEFIKSRKQATKPKPPARKTDKQSPAMPAFTAADFPPLPGAAPAPKDPPPPPPGGKQRRPWSRLGATPKEEREEVLYSSAELWSIYIEFSARLKQCKTRSDQTLVVAYLVCRAAD